MTWESINLRKVVYNESKSPSVSFTTIPGCGDALYPSLRKVSLNKKYIIGQDYTDLRVAYGSFANCSFENLDTEGMICHRCEFKICDFTYCEGANLWFHECEFEDTWFHSNEWQELAFDCCTFKDCAFDRVGKEPTQFSHCQFFNSNKYIFADHSSVDIILPKHTFRSCALVDAVGKEIEI